MPFGSDCEVLGVSVGVELRSVSVGVFPSAGTIVEVDADRLKGLNCGAKCVSFSSTCR